MGTRVRRLFARGSWRETLRIGSLLRQETVGGGLLLVGAAVALVWANSPWAESYVAVRDLRLGPDLLHLDLSIGSWAADGLLAIFFFVVGLELKQEFVAGDLRNPRVAALPVAAAIGGMAVPALIFVAVNARAGDALAGWAIPTATDIAFALAVLAVINTHLPAALRTFLLTLAVVDDLLAIVIIAVFYTRELELAYLGAALLPLILFGLLVQRRIAAWWILVPLAVATWVLVHASGVHATVAGVLLAITVPVLRRGSGDDQQPSLAHRFEHVLRPVSTGFAVPVFALFAAGVTIGGIEGLAVSLTDSVTLGIVLGLVVGKTIGIAGAAFLVARFTRAELDSDLRWIDIVGLAMLAGIGFTVSLLIGDLAYGPASVRDQHVKIGVLVGSVLAAAIAAVMLKLRNRVYRRILEAEEQDRDRDGMPDVFEDQPEPEQ
ncbi:Na+/H+ antiporter NhaA [Microlunatus parietis]|uniref:Na+/H+ antiporter NhaA n=1 Tax=Microlunatus parietis TaxID=682979 RepID=UPI0015C7B06F|nr:Na+/H+ antiporter NhaA [Microlunatus parietis]